MSKEASPASKIGKPAARPGWRAVFLSAQSLAYQARRLACEAVAGVTFADMAGGDPVRYVSIAAVTEGGADPCG